MAGNPLLEVKALGQSLWLDDMRREMLDNGELARWIEEQGLSGMTSNPTIFEKDIVERHAYDREIAALSAQGASPEEIYEHLALEDIQRAADLFSGVYRQSSGADGFISLEVSPQLANDTQRSIAEAQRLWKQVDRPNAMIKVPGTKAGLPAVEELIAQGINVNVTLLFGLQRYREVVERFVRGLERRKGEGQPIGSVASVASFFLSRIDTLVDRWLDQSTGAGSEGALAQDLRGETAIASARLAYQMHRKMFAGPRWEALSAAGARPQRLLWASTSTKDPMYSDVKYVEALIGPNTVNTLPLETLQAFRDHGRPASRLESDVQRARWVLDSLARLGFDLDDATQRLEVEGVEKFSTSFDKLLGALERRQEAVAG
jgi:transaldolase